MGRAKTMLFEDYENDQAIIGKAMGHPARVRIIQLLKKEIWLSEEELIMNLQLSQPTVSEHLCKLERAGFISHLIRHGVVVFALNRDTLSWARLIMDELLFDSEQVEQRWKESKFDDV